MAVRCRQIPFAIRQTAIGHIFRNNRHTTAPQRSPSIILHQLRPADTEGLTGFIPFFGTSKLTTRMKDKMEKIMHEGSKTDTARYCIGLITGRGIVRDKSTIIIKVGEKEVVQLNKLFRWLDVDTSIFTIGEEFIVVVKSSSFIKYLHDLLQKEGSSTIIWGKKIREWGEWPESRVNEDSQFVRGYMEGVHALKANSNPKSKDFELQTM